MLKCVYDSRDKEKYKQFKLTLAELKQVVNVAHGFPTTPELVVFRSLSKMPFASSWLFVCTR